MSAAAAVSPFRVITKPGLPLTVLISCLEERVQLARAFESRGVGVGALAELIEETIPHLKRLHVIEASHA